MLPLPLAYTLVATEFLRLAVDGGTPIGRDEGKPLIMEWYLAMLILVGSITGLIVIGMPGRTGLSDGEHRRHE